MKFPEVRLTDKSGTEKWVKLLSLEGNALTVLPFPYWQTEAEIITIDQIYMLKIKKHTFPALTWSLATAEIAYMLVASVAGSRAHYDGDYQAAVGLGALGGSAAGLGMLLLHGFELKEMFQPEYYFPLMTEQKRLRTIKNIMGVKNR